MSEHDQPLDYIGEMEMGELELEVNHLLDQAYPFVHRAQAILQDAPERPLLENLATNIKGALLHLRDRYGS